jgi:hypothetical protein
MCVQNFFATKITIHRVLLITDLDLIKMISEVVIRIQALACSSSHVGPKLEIKKITLRVNMISNPSYKTHE